jgi:hypothetical protein
MDCEFRQDAAETAFVDRDRIIQTFAPNGRYSRSQKAFAVGVRMGVLKARTPKSFKVAPHPAEKVASRSWITNLKPRTRGIAGCPSAVGCSVTLTCRIRRERSAAQVFYRNSESRPANATLPRPTFGWNGRSQRGDGAGEGD